MACNDGVYIFLWIYASILTAILVLAIIWLSWKKVREKETHRIFKCEKR